MPASALQVRRPAALPSWGSPRPCGKSIPSLPEESVFSPIGLGTLEITFQYSWNPTRCHRTTVSGVTTIKARFHPDQHRRVKTQKSLSKAPSLGLGCLQLRTCGCFVHFCLKEGVTSADFYG